MKAREKERERRVFLRVECHGLTGRCEGRARIGESSFFELYWLRQELH